VPLLYLATLAATVALLSTWANRIQIYQTTKEMSEEAAGTLVANGVPHGWRTFNHPQLCLTRDCASCILPSSVLWHVRWYICARQHSRERARLIWCRCLSSRWRWCNRGEHFGLAQPQVVGPQRENSSQYSTQLQASKCSDRRTYETVLGGMYIRPAAWTTEDGAGDEKGGTAFANTGNRRGTRAMPKGNEVYGVCDMCGTGGGAP